MREQVCEYMCPYARFQSAMFDRDTLIVSYDARSAANAAPARTSTRAPLAWAIASTVRCACRSARPGSTSATGCSTRCIGCGLCVDACNSVMDKVHLLRGLIRYDTQNGLAGRWSPAQVMRRVFRPRVLVYAGVLTLLVVGLLASLVTRTPLKVDVVRDRASLARLVEGDRLENVYRLQVMNATESVQRATHPEARGLDGLTLASENSVEMGPAEPAGCRCGCRSWTEPPRRAPTPSISTCGRSRAGRRCRRNPCSWCRAGGACPKENDP